MLVYMLCNPALLDNKSKVTPKKKKKKKAEVISATK